MRNMAAKNPEKTDVIFSLELVLEEQRRDYDVLAKLHERTETKTYTLLAASFALLTYLYSSVADKQNSFADRLFIPEQLYGVVIYFGALFVFLISIAILLYAIKVPYKVATAFDNEQDDEILADYEKYLRYMKKRYLRASSINIKAYQRKHSLYNLAFLPLVLSAILLLSIKTFGG